MQRLQQTHRGNALAELQHKRTLKQSQRCVIANAMRANWPSSVLQWNRNKWLFLHVELHYLPMGAVATDHDWFTDSD